MNWDGFLMGISDFGLERLKEERQKKMQKDLLELQEQYKIDAEERAERLEARKVHTSRETGDGVMQGVNVFGDDVGNPWEISAEERRTRQRAEETHDDTMLTRESQRNYQTRSLDLRGQELSERRAAREAGMNGAPEMPELDGPGAIEQIFAPILSSANNPAEEALLWQVVNETYESAMSPGAPNPPSAARMRDMARRTIAERMSTGQFGQTWRHDPAASGGPRKTQ